MGAHGVRMVVIGRRRRQIVGRIPLLPGPKAEINVLVIEEKAVVEAA